MPKFAVAYCRGTSILCATGGKTRLLTGFPLVTFNKTHLSRQTIKKKFGIASGVFFICEYIN